jgi:hypothetical protein
MELFGFERQLIVLQCGKGLSSTGFSLCSFDFRLPQIKTTQAEACATEKPQAEA